MKMILARHGESEANLLHIFSNRGLQHGLTERGRAQAAALAQRLEPLSVARIFSSPLLRAVQSAEILAAALRAPLEIVDALREYDCGVLEGRSDAASWAEYQRVLDEWLVHRRWESRIEGGESFVDMRERFVPFVERLVAEYGDSPQGIVLVGHGGLYRCMLPLVLANVDLDVMMHYPLGHTEFVVAEAQDGRLVCVEDSGFCLALAL